MQVFGFDLLAYPEHMDHLKVDGELPYPLPKQHFRPDMAVRNYAEHLDAWVQMEELGFDGIGFNEHHTSPYGLMTSPNLMAAAASQRTHRMKLLFYGNLLPIHNPLRLAEELSMLDCLSNGRLISGFARGIPREYVAYGVAWQNRAPGLRKPGRSSNEPGPRRCSPTRANSGRTKMWRSGRAPYSSPILRCGCL
jgi:Luciferase-like monooxygenase